MEDAWTREEQIPEFRLSANVHLEIKTVSVSLKHTIKSKQWGGSKSTQIGIKRMSVASGGQEREVRLTQGGRILW